MKVLFVCIVFIFNFLHICCAEKSENLFKIKRVKSKGDYYIIIATRNDSLFKIISKKTHVSMSNLELIKKGGCYYFDFGSSNKKISEVKTESLSGFANYLDVKNNHVFIDGKTKIRFTKRFHYRLYTTKNLVGLYYVANPN